MIFDTEGNITLITQEKLSIVEMVRKLQTVYEKYKNDNIVISLTSLNKISAQDVIEFLLISNQHRKRKHSFVIVADNIDLDSIPDELIIVPTIQEAYDIIEMEEIERDLGL